LFSIWPGDLGSVCAAFEGTKLVLFCVILGLLGALTTFFVLWYLHSSTLHQVRQPGGDTRRDQSRHAAARCGCQVHQANRAGAKSLASLPLTYVIGDENSAKDPDRASVRPRS